MTAEGFYCSDMWRDERLNTTLSGSVSISGALSYIHMSEREMVNMTATDPWGFLPGPLLYESWESGSIAIAGN